MNADNSGSLVDINRLVEDVRLTQGVWSFDPAQIQALGKYVYALRDPRNGKVFYVGQGTGNRVLQHLEDALAVIQRGQSLLGVSSKLRHIIDIWMSAMPVEWAIVSVNVENQTCSKADLIESACHDILVWSQGGWLTNEVKPPCSSFLSSNDLVDFAAKLACFDEPLTVFLFNITNAIDARPSIYDATRMYWKIGAQWQNPNIVPYGVGLVNGISKGAYKIDRWLATAVPAHAGKSEFEAVGHPNPSVEQWLMNLNWRKIIRGVGYWQYGRPIVVEFNGKGGYRIALGMAGEQEWSPCSDNS